jgi:hypothetical protein
MLREDEMLKVDYHAMPAATDPCEAEHRLLLALLERALRDALGIKGVNAPDHEHHHRRAAQAWFGVVDKYISELEPDPWSFQWVCSHLSIDAECIHYHIKRAIAHGPSSFLHQWLVSRCRNRTFRRVVDPRKIKTAA